MVILGSLKIQKESNHSVNGSLRVSVVYAITSYTINRPLLSHFLTGLLTLHSKKGTVGKIFLLAPAKKGGHRALLHFQRSMTHHIYLFSNDKMWKVEIG